MSKLKITLISLSAITFIALGTLIVLYTTGLKAPSDESKVVSFVVESGSTNRMIVDNLYDAGLLKNKYSAMIYLRLNSSTVFQAGKYNLNENMTAQDIFSYLSSGRVVNDSIDITFIEGERLTKYAEQISGGFGFSTDEIILKLNDRDYLTELIEKYWFLSEEILDNRIYYGLEGYLYPDTYSFSKDATIEEIIETMLNNTEKKLEPIRKEIESSEYSVHEILSMASIVEKEALTKEDREKVSQVIYKRLSLGMSLGMDVTTYYALQIELYVDDDKLDYSYVSPYNTRDNINMAGKLPIGPICSPSLESIEAVLNPSQTNYLYFYADVLTGEVYFAEDYEGFMAIIREIG